MRASGAIGFLAAVAAVALLPLYGDPGPSAVVSHAEWARTILRGLDLVSESPGVNDTAAQVFATLSGRQSRTFSAEQYVRATRVGLADEAGVRRLRPLGGVGEAVYAVAIARPGDYHVRFRIGGAAAEAELTRAGEHAVLRRFDLPALGEVGWVDAGTLFLAPGAYETTVLLPEGCALQHVELAPPCVHPIEPRGGWRPSAVATTRDVAVTLLQALDLESELPPGGETIDFQAGGPQAGAGSQRLLVAQVPAAGLYTLLAFGVAGGGQRWQVDGCRAAVVCADPTAAAPAWRPILSAELQQGRHAFAAVLGAGASLERLRLEPKKASPEDYAGAVERLGLALGADGPLTRAQAEQARRFLERRRAERAREDCGDLVVEGTLVAETAVSGGSGAGGSGTGGPAGPTGGGAPPPGGGSTVPPPITPPVPPASPTLPSGF